MLTAPREVRASGLDYLELATRLLQRARRADPDGGVWEAADLQWWWRMPRRSDAIEQIFWRDDDGPVAAVVLTDWGRTWGCDPIVVAGTDARLPDVWARAVDEFRSLGIDTVEVLARDDDEQLLDLLASSRFVATDDRSGVAWMAADARPALTQPPDGFVLVDRAGAVAAPHPMRRRNGAGVEIRLRQCSLYDPELDLAVEAPDGTTAGYALFWFDPVTRVGLLEPMRVEDEYQRRGLARTMIATGLERLAARGAHRFKVGYSTDAARRLYVSSGFRVAFTATAFARARRA